MEKLLDYLLTALLGHDVTYVHSNVGNGNSVLTGKNWIFCLEGRVYFVIDEDDLKVIRRLYESRMVYLDEESKKRYNKIFDSCI